VLSLSDPVNPAIALIISVFVQDRMWALEQVLGQGVWPFVDAEQHITG
jgi:hypothetical protein